MAMASIGGSEPTDSSKTSAQKLTVRRSIEQTLRPSNSSSPADGGHNAI